MLDTVKAGYIADAAIRLRGWEPSAYALTGNQRETLAEAANQAVRAAWAYQMWPALMRTEARRFRPDWSASSAYLQKAEVWHGSAYWRALSANSAKEPAAGSAYWEEAAGLVPFIQFEQPWEENAFDDEGFDLNAFAWPDDPRQNPFLPAIKGCRLWMDTVVLPPDAPPQVWIRFKPKPPVLGFTEWSAAAAYEAGDTAFSTSTGRCWRARKDVAAGAALEEGENWSEQRVPRMFEPYVAAYCVSQWLTRDEGRYEEEARAQALLEETAQRQLERRGGDGERPRVSAGRRGR